MTLFEQSPVECQEREFDGAYDNRVRDFGYEKTLGPSHCCIRRGDPYMFPEAMVYHYIEASC